MSYVRGMGRSYQILDARRSAHPHPIRMAGRRGYVISAADGRHVHPISLGDYVSRVRGMGQDEGIDIVPFSDLPPEVVSDPSNVITPDLGSSFNWASALSQIALGGEKIAGAILQKPGQFTQTIRDPRTGQLVTTTSYGVPGAVPSGGLPYLGGSSSISSFLPIALLGLGGVALVAFLGRGH